MTVLDDRTKTMLKRAQLRIVPLLALLYFISFLDRVNIGFAALTMNADIGLSPRAFGLGAGIFFVGYLLFSVPANIVLQRVGASRWIGTITILWGIVSAGMAFVQTPTQFLILRFLLGMTEAGFFPGVIFYLSSWFPDRIRGRIIGNFFVAVPLSNVLGAPVSSWLLDQPAAGFAGWQIMFMVEALPAILFGIIAWLVLPDSPRHARWLAPEEREALTELLEKDTAEVQSGSASAVQGLAAPRVWGWGLIYFLIVIALYGFGFWAPQILKAREGLSDLAVGIFISIPYAVAAIAMLPWARHSDRTGERTWHLVIPSMLGAAGFLLAAVSGSLALTTLAFTLGVVGVYAACPVFWTLPASALSRAAAASGIALINSLGNAAGYVGPFAMGWLRQSTGGYVTGLALLSASMFAAAVVALILRVPRKVKPSSFSFPSDLGRVQR
jgi:ACS family tartrate transporter-like MFS transporter